MILIADSGASKTDWRLILSPTQIVPLKSSGWSPYFMESAEMIADGKAQLLPKMDTNWVGQIRQIYFYGTGCSNVENCKRVEIALQNLFPAATQIAVAHDLLGAARALCGREAGIACILGTGSHACLFDGENITAEAMNLGFWLGDEGSGGYLGKRLLTAWAYREMPPALHQKLQKRYQLDRNTLLARAYQQPKPNEYFASFSHFLLHNLEDPFCYTLVYEAFLLFLERHVCKFENYDQLPVHFTGSIAFYFGNILRKAAQNKGIWLKNIVEKPIAGLTLYHNL
ncbi:N-acetylglucosamine kinase [Hugenholtzia roseola]|uniref:N-acetylglucosamine kinase n=1 Tax=Hugenholtzia roseola TaxID=1002 RepID=UPI0004148F72|nr:N-acetylglucosamine kinase [Hugenholtzia roseola]